MGLIDFLCSLGEDDSEEKIFDTEADAFGLTEEERDECRRDGITPEEWAEDAHDAGLYDD